MTVIEYEALRRDLLTVVRGKNHELAVCHDRIDRYEVEIADLRRRIAELEAELAAARSWTG